MHVHETHPYFDWSCNKLDARVAPLSIGRVGKGVGVEVKVAAPLPYQSVEQVKPMPMQMQMQQCLQHLPLFQAQLCMHQAKHESNKALVR